MNKDTFTAALKHAQEVQGAYKIEPSRRDALFDELAAESGDDVLDALKRIGRTELTINYFNIKRYVDERRAGRERGKRKPEPVTKGETVPEAEVRGMLDKLFGKNWRGKG